MEKTMDSSIYKTIIQKSNTIKRRLEEDKEDIGKGNIVFQIIKESQDQTIEVHRRSGPITQFTGR